MICFNCGLKIHSKNDNECRFCGVKFSGRCSACGFPNPQAARFCFNCGNRMANPEGQSSVENYGTLAESRKNAAVMFADISGFTALSEKLDPEEVREIINECFNYITGPVYELEGTIDKYIGDCVMVLFGARYTHTDDAKRIVMCAMKMMDLIADFSAGMLSGRGIKLNLSIGINYGLVVTGGVGNYFDRDYTVMGDIVNTAQRLQISAGEGVILVSESIYTETKGSFEYSDPIEVKVKNKENPVKCYKPLGINTDYIVEEELSFIERQKELGTLNALLNDALNTGLKCAMVTGEAGLGKTRLLREFTSKLGNDIKRVWVDLSTISQNRSYSLIANILSGIMNINAQDSINTRKHRLISFLDFILDEYNDEEIKHSYDFLGLLMGFDPDSDFKSIFRSMSYENIRRELLKQLALFFKCLCRKQKLLVIADDTQWADTSSIQLLNDLIPMLSEIKAVFIFSSRYELKQLGLARTGDKSDIRLNPLSVSGIRSLTCAVMNSQGVEDGLFSAILEFTKGNPLFIRELLSNIKRQGICSVLEGKASIPEKYLKTIPANIQNLIRSNLSALDATSLKILQSASVIGKEFTFSLVSHLLGNSITNEDLAGIPVKMNIIALKSTHMSSRIVDKTYEFTHEIEREVIYDSLLNKEKAALHKMISEYIETVYSKDIENYYEVLCQHLIRAGIPKKAAEYYFKAGLKLKDGFDLTSALEYFDRFIELWLEISGNTIDDRVFEAYREKGHIHFIKANYCEALEQYSKAIEYARMQDDKNSIRLQIAEVNKDMGNIEEATRMIEELEPIMREGGSNYGKWIQLKCNLLRIKGDTSALNLAKKSERAILKTGDLRSLSDIMKHAGMIYFSKGDIDHALYYMNKSYRYAEKNKLLEIMAKVSGDLGIIYHSTGMISKAFEFFNKSIDISKKLSYQRGVIAGSINLGILYLDKGLFVSAGKLFEESLEIAKEVGSKLYECVSLTNLGDIAYETGGFETAAKCFQDSLSLAGELEASVEEGVNYTGLGRIHLKFRRFHEAAELFEKAWDIFVETDELAGLGDCHIYKGFIDQKTGRLEAAKEHYEKALEIFGECRNDNKKIKALRYKGSLLMAESRYEEALELFGRALSEAEKLESDYECAKCWFGKYTALKSVGHNDEAALSLLKAAEYIKRVDSCRWTDIISACRL